jgi:hypothetical protein
LEILKFGEFVLTRLMSLEWLKLSGILSFLQLYAYLVAIIGILVAGGILSISPTISYRTLPSLLIVDPQEFYALRYEKQRAPDELTSIIANKPEELFLLSTKKTVFQNDQNVRPEGWMFRDIHTSLPRNVGITDAFPRVGDSRHVKKLLGMAQAPEISPTRLTDEQLLFFLEFLGWSSISEFFKKKLLPTGKALADLEPIIDQEASQAFDTWFRLHVASQLVSVVLIENDSNLLASNVHITISYAGHIQGVQPFLLWTPSQSPFKFDKNTNSIDVFRIAPGEQLVVLTLSKSPVLRKDLRVSWDRFSQVNKHRVVRWLVMLAFACIIIVILSMIPDFLKK